MVRPCIIAAARAFILGDKDNRRTDGDHPRQTRADRAGGHPPDRAPDRVGAPAGSCRGTHAAWGGAIGAAILVIVLFFVFIFQWNWLRGPLASEISSRLHRPVAIKGDLTVHPWSWTPTATVNGLVVGNPAWAGAGPMAALPQLTVSVSLPDLLRGRLILPLVAASRPDIRLLRQADGRANWTFSDPSSGQPLKLPPIRRLAINDGQLRIDDHQRKLTFVGQVTSNEAVNGVGRGVFNLTGQGVLNQAPFAALVTGGALIDVDPDRPYPFSANVHAGATHIIASGQVVHPFDLGQMTGQIRISGVDLAKLYDLSGLALPSTPPYDLSAGFSRLGRKVSFSRLHGTVGESDLAGALAVDENSGRPMITGDLASHRLRLVDLAAVIGGGPRRIVGRTVSPEQAAMAAKLNAEHRLLPDEHLAVGRVRATDARVTYRAEVVDPGTAPVRAVYMKVRLDHGVLGVDPLELTLPQGALSGAVRIDARPNVPIDTVDLKLTGAQIADFIGRAEANPPGRGRPGRQARPPATSNSVRAAAASDGSLHPECPARPDPAEPGEADGIDAGKGFVPAADRNRADADPLRRRRFPRQGRLSTATGS